MVLQIIYVFPHPSNSTTINVVEIAYRLEFHVEDFRRTSAPLYLSFFLMCSERAFVLCLALGLLDTRVELYLNFPSEPSCAITGRILLTLVTIAREPLELAMRVVSR